MRVLALDYGTARCGCAISDPTGTLVTPLAAVQPPAVEEIARLATDQGAECVVVGLPVSLSGKEGEQARITRAFAEDLAAQLEIPVETYDERLTTALAARSAREGARADEDSLAAAHLLESYLAAQAGSAAPGAAEAEAEAEGEGPDA
jgi:putative Holliday junction resolvase